MYDGVTVLPENFTRQEDWDNWVSHFESTSVVCDWSGITIVDAHEIGWQSWSHFQEVTSHGQRIFMNNKSSALKSF